MADNFSQDLTGYGVAPIDDARMLITQFGDDASIQADFFSSLEREGISIDRPLGHWAAVERAVTQLLSGRA